MEILGENKSKFFKILAILMIVLSVYVAVLIFSELKKDSMLGESATPATISFSGHGEVTAAPDIANVYFTISQDSKTVEAAQAGVASIEKKALDFLKSKGVDDKDIKTTNASFYPKYEYNQAVCPAAPVRDGSSGVSSSSAYYCPPGKQVLVGYTATESITVKIRKIDNAGEIMQGLGTTGVSNLSGPDFAIDKEDNLKAEARKEAIDDAKAKAESLAKDLGVTLGKITSFSESGNYPMMYADSAMLKSSGAPAPASAVLPKGENTITSDVTITYEIK